MAYAMAGPKFRGAIRPVDEGGLLSKSRYKGQESWKGKGTGKGDARGSGKRRTEHREWLSSGASPGVVA